MYTILIWYTFLDFISTLPLSPFYMYVLIRTFLMTFFSFLTKFGVEESTSHEVGSVEGGGGARSSGVGDRREKSGVFEGEEGIRKVGEGLTVTRETGGREEDTEAAIVFRGGGEIEPASAMLGPRRTSEGRVKSDDKLARGMDGMGGKVVGGEQC